MDVTSNPLNFEYLVNFMSVVTSYTCRFRSDRRRSFRVDPSLLSSRPRIHLPRSGLSCFPRKDLQVRIRRRPLVVPGRYDQTQMESMRFQSTRVLLQVNQHTLQRMPCRRVESYYLRRTT